MIKEYSLLALEKTINHTLALDDNMPSKIAALHGKLVEIIITPLGVNFFVSFEEKQVKLRAQSSRNADTIIHSSPIGLIRLSLLPASQARSLFNNTIRLSGDTELGQNIKKLFDELDIDWGGHLAHFTGDVIAHKLGSLISSQKHLALSLRRNFSDYLQEELRFFPTREEIEDFFKDVDTLALDVERLEAKIKLALTGTQVPRGL